MTSSVASKKPQAGRRPAILILARSGSLSIKNKNLASGPEVGGRSLVERAIETAVLTIGHEVGRLNLFYEDVFVYTDDEYTRILSERCGAVGVPRPKKLSKPTQSSEDVVAHFLKTADLEFAPDPLCLLQLTSPFVVPDDLLGALELYQEPQYDSAVTATKFHRFLGLGGTTGIWEQLYPRGRPRRQDMAETWMESGMFYLAERDAWLRGSRFGRSPGIVEISDPNRCIEVDEPDDLAAAQALSAVYDGHWRE